MRSTSSVQRSMAWRLLAAALLISVATAVPQDKFDGSSGRPRPETMPFPPPMHTDNSDPTADAAVLLQVEAQTGVSLAQIGAQQCSGAVGVAPALGLPGAPSSLQAPCCGGLSCPYAGGVCCQGSMACCPSGSMCLPTQPGQPAACAVMQPQFPLPLAGAVGAGLGGAVAPGFASAPTAPPMALPPGVGNLPLPVQVQLMALAQQRAQAQQQQAAQQQAAATVNPITTIRAKRASLDDQEPEASDAPQWQTVQRGRKKQAAAPKAQPSVPEAIVQDQNLLGEVLKPEPPKPVNNDDDPVGQLSELFSANPPEPAKVPVVPKPKDLGIDGTATGADPENDPYVIKKRAQPADPASVNPDSLPVSQIYDDSNDDKKDDGPTPPGEDDDQRAVPSPGVPGSKADPTARKSDDAGSKQQTAIVLNLDMNSTAKAVSRVEADTPKAAPPVNLEGEPERRDEADEREAEIDAAERIRREQQMRREMIKRKLQRRTPYCVVRSKPEQGPLRTLLFANERSCGKNMGPLAAEYEGYLTFFAFREPLPSTQAFCVRTSKDSLMRASVDPATTECASSAWSQDFVFYAYTSFRPGTVPYCIKESANANERKRLYIDPGKTECSSQYWKQVGIFFAFDKQGQFNENPAPLNPNAGASPDDLVNGGNSTNATADAVPIRSINQSQSIVPDQPRFRSARMNLAAERADALRQAPAHKKAAAAFARSAAAAVSDEDAEEENSEEADSDENSEESAVPAAEMTEDENSEDSENSEDAEEDSEDADQQPSPPPQYHFEKARFTSAHHPITPAAPPARRSAPPQHRLNKAQQSLADEARYKADMARLNSDRQRRAAQSGQPFPI